MRNIIGLVIVIFGVGLLLQQMNVGWADTLTATWWPILIIAVGVLSWRSNRHTWFGPLIITLVGFTLLLDQVGGLSHSAWNYFWPLIIVLVGARIVMGKAWTEPKQETTSTADASVIFSGVDRKINGPFEHANVSAWFGGIKLDLRNAQFADNASLEVFAGFGGVDVFVPSGVRVTTKVMPLFGGADDKTHPSDGATKTLHITGTAMFGGVSIKN